MKKQLSLGKSSFSLFETIIALTILSIVIGSFLKSSNYNSTEHVNLQTIKNKLIQENSTDITHSTFGFEYNVNSKLDVTLLNSGSHTKFIYNKSNIFFEKYTLLNNPLSLKSKVFK